MSKENYSFLSLPNLKLWKIKNVQLYNIAGFMKTVPSMYTLLVNNIYLFLSKQVAEGTVFRKHTSYSLHSVFCSSFARCMQRRLITISGEVYFTFRFLETDLQNNKTTKQEYNQEYFCFLVG